MRTPLFALALASTVTLFGASCATETTASPPPGGGKHGAGMHAGHGGGMHAGHGGGGAACPMDGGASATALPDGVSAVQNEMRLLNHAFHKSMTAAALGDVSVIPPLFHEVHKARGMTDQAIAAGTWKPAKGELADFKTMDAAFHGELEKLVHAAMKNDRGTVVDQLNRLLPSCVACHDTFREPGLPGAAKAAP
jgi:Cytochrome C'